MTRLLEEAFGEAQKLPPEDQDALAQRILDNLRDDRAWDNAFERTTDEQWDRMAESVRSEIASGDTEPLGNLLR